jgi:hypothetical protein
LGKRGRILGGKKLIIFYPIVRRESVEELLAYLKERYEHFSALAQIASRPAIHQQDARSKAEAYGDAYKRLKEAAKR